MSLPLAPVDDFALRLNGIEVSDVGDLLYQSLVSASIQVLTDLRSDSFDVIIGQVDDYSIDKQTAFRDERYLSFKLRNGFVNQSTNALTVTYGRTIEDISTQPPLEDEYVRINEEKGLVIIDMWGLYGSSIATSSRVRLDTYYQYIFRITYDCGLDITAIPEGDIYVGAPDWLRELALLKAREVYHRTNPIYSNDGTPVSVSSGSASIQPLIDKHIRLFPLALTSILL